MKYIFTFKEGLQVIFKGEIESPKDSTCSSGYKSKATAEEMDSKMFEVERVVNTHSSLRLHIERED